MQSSPTRNPSCTRNRQLCGSSRADAAAVDTAVRRVMLALCGLCVAFGSIGDAVSQDASPRLFAPGIVSTGFDDSHLSFAPDGNSIFFLRNTPDFMHWTVLTTRRVGDRWSNPSVAPFSGRWSDADVFITRDGQRLFFVSTRPVDGHPKDDTDIWVMAREGRGWSQPQHVAELSSPGFEWFPTMTDTGVLYFGSERDGGAGRSDLWRARWLGDRFSEPENLGPLFNTADQEIEPLIAPDESWLIFAARGRTPSAGNYDLYISYYCPRGWTAPTPMGGGVNSDGWDFAPRFDPTFRRFYFTSNRADTAGPFDSAVTAAQLERRLRAPRNGLRDVYEVDASALSMRRHCD